MANIAEEIIKRYRVELTCIELEVIRKVLDGEDLDRDEIKVQEELARTFNGFGPSSV